MTIRKERLDELLASMDSHEDFLGPDGLLNKLTGALMSRMMNAEMDEHLSEDRAEAKPSNASNDSRGKTVKTPKGELQVPVLGDRQSTFEPQLIPKRQTRFQGFGEQLFSLYGRGMTVREFRDHLGQLYNVEVSPDLISRATDAVLDELHA